MEAYAEEYGIPPPHPHISEHYDNDHSTFGDPIPIVQRENSLTRMRDMFTDNGRASHAVTEIPLPAGTNRYTMTDLQSPVEVQHGYPSRHQPVVVNNTTTHSIRPDFDHAQVMSERARGKRPEHRRDYSPEVRHGHKHILAHRSHIP